MIYFDWYLISWNQYCCNVLGKRTYTFCCFLWVKEIYSEKLIKEKRSYRDTFKVGNIEIWEKDFEKKEVQKAGNQKRWGKSLVDSW